jgi:hypothetical protein
MKWHDSDASTSEEEEQGEDIEIAPTPWYERLSGVCWLCVGLLLLPPTSYLLISIPSGFARLEASVFSLAVPHRPGHARNDTSLRVCASYACYAHSFWQKNAAQARWPSTAHQAASWYRKSCPMVWPPVRGGDVVPWGLRGRQQQWLCTLNIRTVKSLHVGLCRVYAYVVVAVPLILWHKGCFPVRRLCTACLLATWLLMAVVANPFTLLGYWLLAHAASSV